MEKSGSPTTSARPHAGAEYTHFAGRPVPNHYGDLAAEYTTLKDGTAITERPHKILRLSGKDPIGMLDAVLTNEVPAEKHRGVYALLLDPKGRVQTDLRVLKSGEDILVVTEPEGADAARDILGRYAPFSRVKLGGPESWSILGLYGSRAASLLGNPELKEHETAVIKIDGDPVLVAGVVHPVPGYDLLGHTEALQRVHERLVAERATPVGLQAYETVRVESKTPRFGADITPENFPAEAGVLDRAVSFSKGCYPGQETVARMHYRGHPNRTLHRLRIEGAPPPPDTPILQNEKQVGKITSIAPLPIGGEVLALGYLHRNAELESSLTTGGAAIVPLLTF